MSLSQYSVSTGNRVLWNLLKRVWLRAHIKRYPELAIESLLIDDSELARNSSQYIEKYLHKIGGKGTRRVVRLMKRMFQGMLTGDVEEEED